MGRRQPSRQNRGAARSARKRQNRTAAVTDRGALARPLDTLVFLAPWIAFYQLALIFVPPDQPLARADRIVAIELLRVFFELFGTTAVIMPGLAVVVILLCTQIASREPWRIDRKAIAWMYVESVLLAIPLLVVSTLLHREVAFAGTVGPETSSWVAYVTLYIGAGIYEELVFRLVLISIIVIISADLLGLPHRATTLVAVLLAALLFAAHHHPPLGSEPFFLHSFVFRTMAGIYIGVVFVFRGYGPAAGLHIAYNLLAFGLGV